MNKCIIIIALIVFLKPVIPVLEYVINYDYISKVLCENKDKPKMHCNGKCHLMKELAKQAESEKPIQNDKKTSINEFEVLFFQQIKSLEIVQVSFPNKSKRFNPYSNLYFHLKGFSVFHPPTLA